MTRPAAAFLSTVALLASSCAEPPAARLVFAPLGDPDNCAASETEIVTGTGFVWVGLRRDGVTIATACVPTSGATTWRQLEDALVHAGAIVGELPLGTPLSPYVMGLPGADACPEGDPTGGIRFCARAEVPFVIDADDGGGTVLVERICPSAWSTQDCFED